MAKSPKQKLKPLYLLKILSERTDEDHRLTMEELLAALAQEGIACERKSVYDDIAALIEFGCDIQVARGKNGGYALVSRDFELAELKLLVDAIQSSRFITHRKSNELIRKLESLASRPQARALQRQVYVTGRAKTLNESIYYNIDKLHAAISAGKQIEFRYFEWKIDFSAPQRIVKHYRHDGAAYRVSPWALTWDDENYYLVGYDAAAGLVKHYRVDKMERIALTALNREGEDHFEDFDMAAYSKKTFGMFRGGEERVRLRCENRFIGAVRDRFGDDLMLSPCDADHFYAGVHVAVSPQFFAWVFGMGGALTIEAPETVRAAYKKQLEAAANLE